MVGDEGVEFIQGYDDDESIVKRYEDGDNITPQLVDEDLRKHEGGQVACGRRAMLVKLMAGMSIKLWARRRQTGSILQNRSPQTHWVR